MFKKNNKDELDMIKKVQELLSLANELEDNYFIKEFYIDNNIETFCDELMNLDGEAYVNGEKADEFQQRFIKVYKQLTILSKVFQTKKLNNNKQDFLYIAKVLNDLSSECLDISKMEEE